MAPNRDCHILELRVIHLSKDLFILESEYSSVQLLGVLMYRLFFVCLLSLTNFSLLVAERPNVIVIMSDDQGGGDYGFMGNEIIRTPSLDAMHQRGATLTNFYVSSVCAPTRASLITGRYNYRTRCIDTYIGRSMMDTEEVTIAEFLEEAGYRTGIYGKWHMGDNYPLRAMDQGFQDSLVHRGGGIGQPSDPIGGEGKYTDPILIKNGEEVAMKGYCTDIYFDAAMDFIAQSAKENKNFFTYIAANAPHGPFHDVPPDLYEEYSKVDFSPIILRKLKGKALEKENNKLARISAMITNIDDNVGRLFKKLDQLKLTNNTIVMYLNDNGPNSARFVGNMRGTKTTVDDGGIRSPLLVHWPAKIKAGTLNKHACAHIDVLPSILKACSVKVPEEHQLDGRSFISLLTNEDATWPKRQLFFQTHRGNEPQAFHHFAVHEGPWKLVHPSGFRYETMPKDLALELYNLETDPMQKTNLVSSKPELVQRLKKDYLKWFKDVSSTRPDNYAPPRIIIGTEHERRSVLTRQDWRHLPESGRPWSTESNGFWLLEAPSTESYHVEIHFLGEHPAGIAEIEVAGKSFKVKVPENAAKVQLAKIDLPKGKMKLQTNVSFGDKVQGPHQVILTLK